MVKDIIGYEGYYYIDENGVISNNARILNTTISNSGYEQVHLWKDNKRTHWYIHKLVARHFIPNPNNLEQVNHINCDKQCNKVINLEWVTKSDNALHAIKHGAKTYTNRLTLEEFRGLLQNVIDGESYKSLSLRVNYKVPFLSTKLRKIAKIDGLEPELNESLRLQKIKRNQKISKR